MTEARVEMVRHENNSFTQRDFDLITELVKSQMEQNQQVDYESFEGYELPPRTQFSMLKKPAVTMKAKSMNFNKAALKMFEDIEFILPMVNPEKKRFAIIPCKEEELASVQWARKKDDIYVSKQITSPEFMSRIFELMGWDKECRYKMMGRVALSERGPILVFDMDEAIMFAPKKRSYVDPVSGETKTKDVKYYPDKYNDTIGQSYADYESFKQLNAFEDFGDYTDENSGPQNETTDTSANTDLPDPAESAAPEVTDDGTQL